MDDKYLKIGTDLAEKLFAKRQGAKRVQAEVHVGKLELAAILALAAEAGAAAGAIETIRVLDQIDRERKAEEEPL